MRVTLADEYAYRLSLLTGDTFEAEVIIALQNTDLGFQRVPRKPNGDGGLDGLSHGHKVGYCCYGPETTLEPGLKDTQRRKLLVKKIVNKFKKDFMRILELQEAKKVLHGRPNKVLEGLFGVPARTKLTHIRLVTNWLEDTRIVGELKAAFAELIRESNCRFAEPDCEVVFWDPTDLANNVRLTQEALIRVEQPSLLMVLREASSAAQTYEPDDQDDFNDKFDDLSQRNPRKKDNIERVRISFKQAWSKSIILDEKLAADLPDIHQKIEELRSLAVNAAELASAQTVANPLSLIESSLERLQSQIGELVHGGLPDLAKAELARAETGRLIGECHLDWREG